MDRSKALSSIVPIVILQNARAGVTVRKGRFYQCVAHMPIEKWPPELGGRIINSAAA